MTSYFNHLIACFHNIDFGIIIRNYLIYKSICKKLSYVNFFVKNYGVFGKLAYWAILAYFDVNRGLGGQIS